MNKEIEKAYHEWLDENDDLLHHSIAGIMKLAFYAGWGKSAESQKPQEEIKVRV